MSHHVVQEEIRKTNRLKICRYIYENPESSSQSICAALDLSRPTVASNLSSLEEDGLIRRVGLQEPGQVGRRSVLYSAVPDYRIAIGVDVMRTKANLIAIDLYGSRVKVASPSIFYDNTDRCFRELCGHILSFIDSLSPAPGQILGVSITMQGLISPDGRTVAFGKILHNTGVKIDAFERYLPYPCSFFHDPAAAALSELQASPELENALYIAMNSHLGGALIVNRHIQSGMHGHSATFEHIQAFPNGKKCYCGQYGCWDTVCSMPALLGEEDPEVFLEKLRAGGEKERASWHVFLTHLARLIKDLHLVNDVPVILGGRLAPFFTVEDVAFLYKEIRRICPFEEAEDFILLSRLPSYNIAIGAALKYIHAFLEHSEVPEETT